MTLRELLTNPEMIPAATGWYLAELGEERGKQGIYTRQSSQRLRLLREYALIESAVSSDRIEGVEVDKARAGIIVFGTPYYVTEMRKKSGGYREAIQLFHEDAVRLHVEEETILTPHRLASGNS